MLNYQQLYQKVEDHVVELFEKHQPAYLTFHNLQHTKTVVQKAKEIAGHYTLSEIDFTILHIAAWFHDTGYLFTTWDKHEEESVTVMKAFLANSNLQENDVDRIASCIMATKMPRIANNLIEEILCDADTFQFGSKKDFKITNKSAYQEMMHHFGKSYSKKMFDEATINMFTKHHFHTSYCKEQLNGEKKEIMKKLKKRLLDDDNYKELESTEITEKDGTTKGMQTMLRLTSSNHIQLSEMADSKANILISVNAIIISVILSVLLRKLQTDPYLTIPTIMFLAFSVITIVIAILATRPKVSMGTFNEIDIVNKETNLLFFGNFHKMTHEQYENAMRTMMRDSDYLYSSIIKDIFYLGQVLGIKYKLIRLAYNIFMVGIVVCVCAFSIAALLYKATPEGVITNSQGSPF